jgi:hypothetical protein
LVTQPEVDLGGSVERIFFKGINKLKKNRISDLTIV